MYEKLMDQRQVEQLGILETNKALEYKADKLEKENKK